MCPSDDSPPPDRSKAHLFHAGKVSLEDIIKEARELLLADQDSMDPEKTARLQELAKLAVEVFLEVLVDPRLGDPEGPGGGWGPVRAANVLTEVAPERSLEPLLDTLAMTPLGTPVYLGVMTALQSLGAKLVDPIFARLPTAIGEYLKDLRTLLARTQVRQPRVFSLLLQVLVEDPEQGALRLAEYGDPAALPYLHEVLDKYKFGPADTLSPDDSIIFEVREAILSLDGALTPEQQLKYERAVWSRRLYLDNKDNPQRERRLRLQADAGCPCGSGRLYRNCCLQ